MNKEERKAFEDAYHANVGSASKETVSNFLDEYLAPPSCSIEWYTANDMYQRFGSDYTSILDALCLWNSAVKFGRTK